MNDDYFIKKGYNNSKIVIGVNTKFRRITEEDFDKEANYDKDMLTDFSNGIEKAFHNAIYEYVEKRLTEDEDFQDFILEKLKDDSEIPIAFKEFNDMGNVGITVGVEKFKESDVNVAFSESGGKSGN